MKHLNQVQLEQLTRAVIHLDNNTVEAPIKSTRGRKPRAIHNPYFYSDVYAAYTTDDVEDICLGIIRSYPTDNTHKGEYLNWLSMAKCIMHMHLFTTAGVMQYLKISRQQADKYMKALYVYTELTPF